MSESQRKRTKPPLATRVVRRARAKLSSGEERVDVAHYIAHSCLNQPRKAADVLAEIDNLDQLLRRAAENEIADVKRRRRLDKTRARQAAHTAQEQREQAERERIEDLQRRFDQARDNAQQRILFGVWLAPQDRRLFFTSAEIREIIELRKTRLSTYQARQALGYSFTEINRWDCPEYLPHRFTQRIQVGGKTVEARFWLQQDIEEAKPKLASWRDAHNLKKRFRRKKHPLSVARSASSG